MSIAIALCFSVVLCTIHAFPSIDSLADAELQIKNAIWKVENTIQRIQDIHTDTKEDTSMKVTKKWYEQMDTYRDYVNLMIESMRREVNNAKLFQGIDAQYCYDTNLCAINKHTDIAYDASVQCQNKAEKSIDSSLGFLDSLILLGAELIKELNDIFLNCHSENSAKMESCVLNELGRLNNAVNQFENDAKNVEYSVSPASNYVVIQATQCLTKAYKLARFETQGAMMSHFRCIRDAVAKKKN